MAGFASPSRRSPASETWLFGLSVGTWLSDLELPLLLLLPSPSAPPSVWGVPEKSALASLDNARSGAGLASDIYGTPLPPDLVDSTPVAFLSGRGETRQIRHHPPRNSRDAHRVSLWLCHSFCGTTALTTDPSPTVTVPVSVPSAACSRRCVCGPSAITVDCGARGRASEWPVTPAEAARGHAGVHGMWRVG